MCAHAFLKGHRVAILCEFQLPYGWLHTYGVQSSMQIEAHEWTKLQSNKWSFAMCFMFKFSISIKLSAIKSEGWLFFFCC